MLDKYDIKEIRFLPLDNKIEFKTEEEVRLYLSEGLVSDEMDGKYYYQNKGIISFMWNPYIT